jgi:hypothetical protein
MVDHGHGSDWSSLALWGSAPCRDGTGSKRAVWGTCRRAHLGGEVVRRANGGGERNPVEAVGVEMLRERR